MSAAVEGANVGEPKALFHARLAGVFGEVPYDVSADGQRFLVLEADPESKDGGVEMVLNWPSLLA